MQGWVGAPWKMTRTTVDTWGWIRRNGVSCSCLVLVREAA